MFEGGHPVTSTLGTTVRKVLVVDDEETVLRSMTRMLGRHLIVDTAASVKEAMFKVFSNDYVAIITDFEMPGRDGLWLLEELKRLAPGSKRVLHSGSDPVEVEKYVSSGVVHHFVQKPASVGDFSCLF